MGFFQRVRSGTLRTELKSRWPHWAAWSSTDSSSKISKWEKFRGVGISFCWVNGIQLELNILVDSPELLFLSILQSVCVTSCLFRLSLKDADLKNSFRRKKSLFQNAEGASCFYTCSALLSCRLLFCNTAHFVDGMSSDPSHGSL